MTKPSAQQHNAGIWGWRSSNAKPDYRKLSYGDVYPCPICRHGQISALTLMEALACDFCRHIFTADLKRQSIRVEDISQPSVWRWNGRAWKMLRPQEGELVFALWLSAGVAIAILSATLLWLAAYIFPPLEGSSGSWVPKIWPFVALLTHLSLFVLWPLAERYQLPLYIVLKVRIQALLARWGRE